MRVAHILGFKDDGSGDLRKRCRIAVIILTLVGILVVAAQSHKRDRSVRGERTPLAAGEVLPEALAVEMDTLYSLIGSGDFTRAYALMSDVYKNQIGFAYFRDSLKAYSGKRISRRTLFERQKRLSCWEGWIIVYNFEVMDSSGVQAQGIGVTEWQMVSNQWRCDEGGLPPGYLPYLWDPE
jgi:hypothetical protein